MNEIILVGLIEHTKECSNKIHREDYVLSPNGIMRTLLATEYKNPTRIIGKRNGKE